MSVRAWLARHLDSCFGTSEPSSKPRKRPNAPFGLGTGQGRLAFSSSLATASACSSCSNSVSFAILRCWLLVLVACNAFGASGGGGVVESTRLDSMLKSDSGTGFFNLGTLLIARPSSMIMISLSRYCFRGLGHGHIWGTATTAKDARSVPAKRVEVALERG